MTEVNKFSLSIRVLNVIISILQVLGNLLLYGFLCPALTQQLAEQSNHPFHQHDQQGEYSQLQQLPQKCPTASHSLKQS